jgi:hypothetical protein
MIEEIYGIIGVLAFVIGSLITVYKFGDDLLTGFGVKSVQNVSLSDLSENSPIKKEFNNIESKVDNLVDKIDNAVIKIENIYWDSQDNRASTKHIEIIQGINSELNKDDIVKLFNEYKNIPTKDGKLRNGYLDWKVKSYLKEENFSIQDYYQSFDKNIENNINKKIDKTKYKSKNYGDKKNV